MARPAKSLLAALATAAVALVPAVGGTSALQATTEPLAGLDPSRVWPDPLIAGDFLQYEPSPTGVGHGYLDGLAELERRYGPGSDHPVITVSDICELVCDDLDTPTLDRLQDAVVRDMAGNPVQITSAGGRALPVITVTAPDTPEAPVEERIDLYFSMSIHGLERAGLEGGLRYVEDLAINYVDEQGGGDLHVLRAGDPDGNPDYAEYSTTAALTKARLHFINPNPDGWAAGDRATPGNYVRGNDAGIDLNRQFPTVGWHNSGGQQYRTGSQPESTAVRAFVEEHLGIPEGAADLHGEFGDNVLLAIMFPAGQFDPLQLQAQYRLAEAIKHNVNTSVHPGAAGLLTEVVEGPVYPAEYHTAYDAIGYDDSGFQGDWLVQQGILEMDHEYIFSNLAPGAVFVPELEQVHVDTTRALLDATIAVTIEAYDNPARQLELDYAADLGGRAIGYVVDPERITSEDVQTPAAFGLPQVPYAVTQMTYFEDLAAVADPGSTVTPVEPGFDAEDLAGYDTVVVADDTLAPDDTAAWAALAAWARGEGHRLVLTDAALQGLEAMGAVPAGSVGRMTQYAGEVQGVDRDDPLLTGVGGLIGQTYFEVPLGYRPGGSGALGAPAWFVDADAWTGSVAAVVGQEDADADLLVVSSQGGPGQEVVLSPGDPALGTLPFGDGSISIFGAILPDPGNVGPNTHGLAGYAVTYAGNAILLNALAGR
jgi:hypothetical protein